MKLEPLDRALRQAMPTQGPLSSTEVVDPQQLVFSVAKEMAENPADSSLLEEYGFYEIAEEYLGNQRLLEVEWNGLDLYYDLFECGGRGYVWWTYDDVTSIVGVVEDPSDVKAITGVIENDWPVEKDWDKPLTVLRISELVDPGLVDISPPHTQD